MERLDLEMRVMSNSGNSILKGMSPIEPMLDLFVRESIQNSYDALLPEKNTLREEFNTGTFDSDKLSNLFEGISNELKIKSTFFNQKKFISVRDYNATGLTGPLNVEDILNQNWGKFLNLVRNFGKSQKEAGSGGSWGYGKTTFYKMGLGIVIYYSRIKNQSTYEERLMACLVENENNTDGLLYRVQEGKNTGIAWWGVRSDNDIIPVSNHEEIMEVLNCFNLKPYENDETGTAVIIPFIDDIKLLNQTSSGDYNANTLRSWAYSLEDYIKMAFQKWYPTKCNNTTPKNKGIDAYINGVKIEKQNIRPLFKVVQDMYNKSQSSSFDSKYDIKEEIIRYKQNPPFKSQVAGILYYTLLDEEQLLMTVPNNEPSPYECATNEEDDGSNKRVIVCFCRKPGMILKYDIDGDWAGPISSPDPNKYLICLFIPNSLNEVAYVENGINYTIDDYLRASESAEHNNWKDITEYTDYNTGKKVDCSKVKLVYLIHRRIKNVFDSMSSPVESDVNEFVGSSLNRKLADLFLPKTGFGHKPKKEILPNKQQEPKKSITKKAKIEFAPVRIENGCISKNFTITFNKNIKNIEIEFKVRTESKDLSINEWEKVGKVPFEIKKIVIDNVMTTDENVFQLNKEYSSNVIDKYINFEFLKSNLGQTYGYKISLNDDKLLLIHGKVIYSVLDSTIPISINEGKGE